METDPAPGGSRPLFSASQLGLEAGDGEVVVVVRRVHPREGDDRNRGRVFDGGAGKTEVLLRAGATGRELKEVLHARGWPPPQGLRLLAGGRQIRDLSAVAGFAPKRAKGVASGSASELPQERGAQAARSPVGEEHRHAAGQAALSSASHRPGDAFTTWHRWSGDAAAQARSGGGVGGGPWQSALRCNAKQPRGSVGEGEWRRGERNRGEVVEVWAVCALMGGGRGGGRGGGGGGGGGGGNCCVVCSLLRHLFARWPNPL
ncbi:hypothetical protein T484DRAFT_2020485 [Baffinella frigidus]|nr:hypothetical protein T484DRAFT_2020485 [Cryptophyta sp. CCMP2293]